MYELRIRFKLIKGDFFFKYISLLVADSDLKIIIQIAL